MASISTRAPLGRAATATQERAGASAPKVSLYTPFTIWNSAMSTMNTVTLVTSAGVPSFSQSGIEETKLGVLMSLSQSSFSSEGRFGAEAIVKVMDGIRPRDVGQVFDSAIGLAINLEMARLIYWDPPFEILLAADAIYQDIKNAGE